MVNGTLKHYQSDDVLRLIHEKSLSVDDWMVLPSGDMRQLGELPEFKDFLPNSKLIESEEANFFLAEGRNPLGPYSRAQIMQWLQKKDLSWFDCCFDLRTRKWMRLYQCPEFSQERIAPNLPKAEKKDVYEKRENRQTQTINASMLTQLNINNELIWYVKKNKTPLGPFRYLDIVKMIQKNVLFRNSVLMKEGEDNWQIIEDIPEFSIQQIKKILSLEQSGDKKSFEDRQHARSTYLSPARVRIKGKFYRGTCSSLSKGGCFIELRTDKIEVGDQIEVEIMPGAINLTIKSHAEIVSVRHKKPQGVGIKFSELNEDLAERINNFVEMFNSKIGREN